MKAIYKFPLKRSESQRVLMSHDAKILSIQFQGTQLCLWALVDTEKLSEHKTIDLFGTGIPIYEPEVQRRFICTLQDGSFVWHFFERL